MDLKLWISDQVEDSRIPLAVLFPGVHFHLIDRIGKKMRVANEIAEAIGMKNVSTQHGDSGECHILFDFVVSRVCNATTGSRGACKKNISNVQKNAIPNGIITLKGGDLTHEIMPLKDRSEIININNYLDEPFFDSKKLFILLCKGQYLSVFQTPPSISPFKR